VVWVAECNGCTPLRATAPSTSDWECTCSERGCAHDWKPAPTFACTNRLRFRFAGYARIGTPAWWKQGKKVLAAGASSSLVQRTCPAIAQTLPEFSSCVVAKLIRIRRRAARHGTAPGGNQVTRRACVAPAGPCPPLFQLIRTGLRALRQSCNHGPAPA
jgi:hypothetical protein